jgi:2-keto-3-deoxy-6-phosphogluconate aldolase
MSSSAITCSESECKKRLADVKNMSFEELERYNVKCANCGSWTLKDNDVANKTYHAISNRWAEEFMNQQMKKK